MNYSATKTLTEKPFNTGNYRYRSRMATEQGLCLWQLNKFLKGSGYRVRREFGEETLSEFILVRVSNKMPPVKNPRFHTKELRKYKFGKYGGYYCTFNWWENRINKKIKDNYKFC